MTNHVHIIKMGGTIEFIDPAYGAINTQIMKLDTSVEAYLNNIIKPHFTFTTETVAEKDSRDIIEQDLQTLAQAIKRSSYGNILVTHGTFTMRKTAQFLEKRPVSREKNYYNRCNGAHYRV